jgi:hypothetical protein
VGGAAGPPANQGRTPVRERILDTRGQAQDDDTRNVINARRTGNAETQAAVGYHPRRGGRYDSREDHSPTPEPPGTRVFSREIRTASFPQRFRQPTSIVKYTGEKYVTPDFPKKTKCITICMPGSSFMHIVT